MRRVGQARKRDANEGAIVHALKQVGASVIRISEPGAPDLLVLYFGDLFLLEIKSRQGRPTRLQDQRLLEGWPVFLTRTANDALKAIGAL